MGKLDRYGEVPYVYVVNAYALGSISFADAQALVGGG